MGGKHAFTIMVACVIAVALLLQLFMFQVRSNEVAILMTFGKPSDATLDPGYHFRFPWPIQVVRKFDNRWQANEGKLVEQYTEDKHSIITSILACWKVGDVKKFNENFGKLDREDAMEQAWARLDPILRDAMNAEVGKANLSDFVSIEEELQYEVVEQAAMQEAAKDAEDFGIELVMLKIKRLELPESAREKVYDRMKQERQEEAEGIRQEGFQRAENIKNEAESMANEIRAVAENVAASIKSEGEREAADIYRIQAENPRLAIFLKQLDALRRLSETGTTFIVDTNTPPWDVLVQEPPADE